MKSGIEAAEAIFEHIDKKPEITEFETRMHASWSMKELYQERNVKKAFKRSMASGILYAGLNGHVFKGREPWNLINHKKDSECLETKDKHQVPPLISLSTTPSPTTPSPLTS